MKNYWQGKPFWVNKKSYRNGGGVAFLYTKPKHQALFPERFFHAVGKNLSSLMRAGILWNMPERRKILPVDIVFMCCGCADTEKGSGRCFLQALADIRVFISCIFVRIVIELNHG